MFYSLCIYCNTACGSVLPQDNCIFKFMHCYLLELEVVLFEDMSVTDNYYDEIKTSIYHRKFFLEEHERQYNSSRCLPCEAQRVANSTIFLYNLERLLERIGQTVSWIYCKYVFKLFFINNVANNVMCVLFYLWSW